jgi:hypothetical protein
MLVGLLRSYQLPPSFSSADEEMDSGDLPEHMNQRSLSTSPRPFVTHTAGRYNDFLSVLRGKITIYLLSSRFPQQKT